MKTILMLVFLFISGFCFSQTPEQSSFDDFMKNYRDQLPDLKFNGLTTKSYSGAFVDYSTCFSGNEQLLDSLAESLNKLQSHRMKIEYPQNSFSRSSKDYKLNIYKATSINDKFVVRIEAVKDGHIHEYYYLLDSQSNVLDNCSRNIFVD